MPVAELQRRCHFIGEHGTGMFLEMEGWSPCWSPVTGGHVSLMSSLQVLDVDAVPHWLKLLLYRLKHYKAVDFGNGFKSV